SPPKFAAGFIAMFCRAPVTSNMAHASSTFGMTLTSELVAASTPSVETPPLSVFHVALSDQGTSMSYTLIELTLESLVDELAPVSRSHLADSTVTAWGTWFALLPMLFSTRILACLHGQAWAT